jgi:L-lactate dehydrogenase complex protein LldE
VFELSQYLVEELGGPQIGSPTGRTVAYHDSCHMLRELRLHEPPRRLLRAVADLHELPRSDRCCGFGGAFAVRYPDVSTAMADDKLATAQAAGAETVVSADPGCIMHIEGRASRTGAPVRVVHLASVLADAL